jgi:hypothetical protein
MPPRRWNPPVFVAIAFAVVAAAALALWSMGQVPICKCGYVKFWHGIVASSENSQHVSDWYTFSHVIHGFAFYGLLWLVARRTPIGLRFLIAVALEASWEVFENTDFVINRYREVTISRDYYGDSVLNSVMDIAWMMVGFAAASQLPIRVIVVLTLAMELFVAYYIRDNLALNILMLIYPLEAVRRWQGGG